MNYPAVIVDDEPHGAESLSLLIQEFCPTLDVKCIATGIDDAVTAIITYRPVLVFLDIQMPDGNGFDVLERTRSMNYKVIFTTAHEQYTLKALRLRASDYLLKPIKVEDLVAAVNNAVNDITMQKAQMNFLQEQHSSDLTKGKIAIPCNEGLLLVAMSKIIRLEADSNYTHLFLDDGRKITASRTLKNFERLLDPGKFMRVHTSHLMNVTKVEKYIKGDGGYVIMSDGSNVPVSRAYKLAFLSKLNGI